MEGGREGGDTKRRTLAIFPEPPPSPKHLITLTAYTRYVHELSLCNLYNMVTLNCNAIQPCVCSCLMHSLWVCTAVLGPDADGVAGSGLKVQLLSRLHASSVHRDVELIHVARHDGVFNLTERTKIIVYGTHL